MGKKKAKAAPAAKEFPSADRELGIKDFNDDVVNLIRGADKPAEYFFERLPIYSGLVDENSGIEKKKFLLFISRLAKKAADEKLEDYKVFDLLKILAHFRKNNTDVPAESLGSDIEKCLEKLSFDESSDSLGRFYELLQYLNDAGVDEVPPSIIKHALTVIKNHRATQIHNAFYSNDVRDYVHLVAHCKNLGIFEKRGENDGEAKEVELEKIKHETLKEATNVIANFIYDRQEYLHFNVATAQAALDFLTYSHLVHNLKIESKEEIFKVLSDNLEGTLSMVKSSDFHQRIFKGLVKDINKSSSQEGWSHVPKVCDQGKIIYGDNILLEMEGDLEVGGVFYRKGDIVVRDLATNRALAVVEVDGPSHFYFKGRPSGKTKIRNKILQAQFGDDGVHIVNYESDIEESLALKSEHIKKIIENEIAKNISHPEVLLADPEILDQEGSSSKEELPEEELPEASKPPRKKKSKHEIHEELKSEFEELLRNYSVNHIYNMLSDEELQKIMQGVVIEGKTPFDFILNKLNDSPKDQDLSDVLLILYCSGFEVYDKALIKKDVQYFSEIKSVLGLQEPTFKRPEKESKFHFHELREILLTRNGYLFATKKIIKHGLPVLPDEDSKEYERELTALSNIVFGLSSKESHRPLYSRLMAVPRNRDKSWIKIVARVASVAIDKNLGVRSFDKFIKKNSKYIFEMFKGEMPLLFSMIIQMENHEFVEKFLEYGAKVNEIYDRSPPLFKAACCEELKVIEVLLKAGANPNLPNKEGNTPLHLAAQENNRSMVEMLLKAGANPNLPNHEGSTALHAASKSGGLAVVEMLLKAGANPNIANKNRIVPLHVAAKGGFLDMVKMLLHNKAEAIPPESTDYLPFDVARNEHLKLEEISSKGLTEQQLEERDNLKMRYFKITKVLYEVAPEFDYLCRNAPPKGSPKKPEAGPKKLNEGRSTT